MKADHLTRIDTAMTEDTARATSPASVCMHVLENARMNVRAMRAATALVEAGYTVTIVDIVSTRDVPVEEHIQGVRVKHLVAPNWYSSRRIKPLFLLLAVLVLVRSVFALLRIRADVYHAHNVTALPASYLAAQLRRKPLIFEEHELLLSDKAHNRLWRGLRKLFSGLLAIVVPRCAGVIAVSPPIVQEIRSRYPASDVALIRNLPVYRAVQKSDRLRNCLGLLPGVRIALYQGGIEANRGLDSLVRAAPYLDEGIVIVMMGQAKEGLQSQLEGLIASEGVADRVRMIPPVPYEELLDWTASADIGLSVLPPDFSLSIRMCLPNKLFEYLMAGLPVLASELEAVVEVITAYDVGQVVSSLSPAEVGAAINRMLADPEALERMRRNALDAAQRELCWDKEKNNLVRLYQKIVGTRQSEARAVRRPE